MIQSGVSSLRRVFVLAAMSLVLFVTGTAFAGGRVEWKSKSMKETDNHSWKIEVAIYLNSTPDVATLPMRFSFQPTVYYERSLLDGKDGPQLRRVPLENKQPIVESVDVGFLDPGSGQIQKRTKFSFNISRGHGFEAGEYDVTIKDGRSDQSMGAAAHVTLEGDNEVIDRRAITFSGEKKKEKKDDDAEKKEEPPMKRELSPDDPGFWEGGPKKSDDEKNEEVEPKRGCGCKVGQAGSEGRSAALLAAVLGGVVWARRRRRAA